MKLALVYDRVNKFGGAERILSTLHEIWPEAPLYTSVYNPQKAVWANDFQIKTSFLQHLPFAQSYHEFFSVLTPYSFETFDFHEFDVVLSVTSSDAKGIITHPDTLHICYCLTPTRYLWSSYWDYVQEPGLGLLNGIGILLLKFFAPISRIWDYIASQRPDRYIAISDTVASRIKAYYKNNVPIIYPPVDNEIFRPSKEKKDKGYFLIVSRLVPYKRIDYVIEAFNTLGWNLKIIGGGVDEQRLKKKAQKNIEFISTELTDRKLCWYYQNCQALIFPGIEDFGLTAIEAQSCGKPVIAIRKGGVGETILPNLTGELYDDLSSKALITALKKFNKKKYLSENCRKNALKFSKKLFKSQIKTLVEIFRREHSRRL